MTDSPAPGVLWIVATPIGNLGDLSTRAATVLAEADVIAAEDTRHTKRLLDHLGIHTRTLSLHEHNEEARAVPLIERLRGGASIALVSDAGTPLISDPGYRLVAAVREAGLTVQTVPGPSAVVAALSISGLPTDRFVFEGFLPAKPGARRKRLAELVSEPRTLVCYESSHRITRCVADLGAVFGQRPVTLARELTKRYEQSVTCPAAALAEWLNADANRVRGEFVLVIGGASESTDVTSNGPSLDQLLAALVPELGTKKAAKLAARLTDTPQKQAYAKAVSLSAGHAAPDNG